MIFESGLSKRKWECLLTYLSIEGHVMNFSFVKIMATFLLPSVFKDVTGLGNTSTDHTAQSKVI
jgi:hypothetical protein